MAYKISGTVLHIGDTLTLPSRSGTPFSKRDLVITVRKFDPYTGVPSEEAGNTPKFSFVNSNCQQLDGLKPGDIVTVLFDISGRSYEKDGRTEYFNDIRPFRVELLRQPQYQQPQPSPMAAPQQPSDPFADPQPMKKSPVQGTLLPDGVPPEENPNDLPF